MENVSNQFGKRIRQIRLSLGMSQEDLAFRASLNTAHLGQIERAKKSPTVDTVDRIAHALGVSISFLFEFDEEPEDSEESPTINKIIAQLSTVSADRQKDILKIIRLIKNG